MKDVLVSKSSEWYSYLTETDWRKASTSSLVSAFDKVYESEILRSLQKYQNFIFESTQKTPDSLVVELVLVADEYKKQGIGTMMLNDLIEYSVLHSIYQIQLFTASKSFTKLDFQVVNTSDSYFHLSKAIKLPK